MTDPCLTCDLPDCDDTAPACPIRLAARVQDIAQNIADVRARRVERAAAAVLEALNAG